MLEVTILKTNHLGAEEAKKLLPHIQNSDAFGLEIEQMTKPRALSFEKTWGEMLVSPNISRNKFTKIMEENAKLCPVPEFREYMLKGLDYLFRNKTPLYHAERWDNAEDATQVYKSMLGGDTLFYLGLRMMNEGKEAEGIRMAYSEVLKSMNNLKIRDKNVAENLATAEQDLREAYTQLKDIDPIKLILQIGRSHRPEEHSDFPIKTIKLYNNLREYHILNAEIENLVYSGAGPDEIYDLCLRVAKYLPKK